MKALALAAALLASLAAPPAARWDWGDAKDDYTGMAESKALCRQLHDREPPASDRPSAAQAQALKGCDSEKLYYGIGMAADPVKARQCAFLEADKGDESVFGGRTMLMMVYANGKGARQDYDVAIHLACGIEGAPAESDARVTDLADRKRRGDKDGDFDYCDGITSGLAAGYCAGHAESVDGAKREAAWKQLTAGWSASDKQALARLRAAHEAFAQASGGGEVDHSGTLGAAMEIGAEEKLRDELLAMIRQLEAGKAPVSSHAQYLAADAALNAAYRKALPEADPNAGVGAVTRQGMRDAQRAWLAYRDAFLAFAALRYPKVGRESLATWLTLKRIEMWKAED
jgi:Lysozyme inhibitor LprI